MSKSIPFKYRIQNRFIDIDSPLSYLIKPSMHLITIGTGPTQESYLID